MYPEISLILTYYENPDELKRQLGLWAALPPKWLSRMEFIVVDDGSPTKPLTPDLMEDLSKPITTPLALRAYRLLKDVGFNNLGARNLGAFVALGTFLMFFDMDCLLINLGGMAEVLLNEVKKRLRPSNPLVLYFRRYVLRTSRLDKPALEGFQKALRRKRAKLSLSPNSFAMLRSHFWSVGGFNEDLSGTYGTDYEFKGRVFRYGYEKLPTVKGRILTLAYGSRRKSDPKRKFPKFPSNPLRLPWCHSWSSPSYIGMVKDQPLALRLVSPHSLSSTFPVLDLPVFPRTKSVAEKNPKSIFGMDKPIGRLPDQKPRAYQSPHFARPPLGESRVRLSKVLMRRLL